jgi:hypothetical protein
MWIAILGDIVNFSDIETPRPDQIANVAVVLQEFLLAGNWLAERPFTLYRIGPSVQNCSSESRTFNTGSQSMHTSNLLNLPMFRLQKQNPVFISGMVLAGRYELARSSVADRAA